MFTEPAQQIDRLAYAVIGAALDVHRWLGPGFLESVYEEAMCVELATRRIAFVQQQALAVEYKGHAVGECRLDLVVNDLLIVELKAVDVLAPIHHAQIMAYLKATRLPLGLLINFNVPVLKQGIKRVVFTHN